MINDNVMSSIPWLNRQFFEGSPFRHVIIDDFFDETFCHQLLVEFPAFDPVHALN